MKTIFRVSTIAAALITCQLALAQATPAAAAKPANATGQCKDGSYSTAASKSGACRGHNGVKEWYTAATTAAPSAATAPAVKAAPATSSAPAAAPSTPSPTTQARTQTQSAAQSASQSTTPPATTSIQKPAPKASTAMPTTPAAGGGPGMVWVNTASNVYHCPGTKYYGKTKAGSYMAEADAKAKGIHADHGNACTK